jgi:uncharacterized protein
MKPSAIPLRSEHTWLHEPSKACLFQFSVVWLARGAEGFRFADVYWARKNLLCVCECVYAWETKALGNLL